MKINYLQKALLINAIFSGSSGLVLVIIHRTLGEIFETTISSPFWIIGLLLLFFSLTIVFEIFKQRMFFVKWIILQDILWVAGSVFLLIFDPFQISAIGNYLIAIVAIIVLIIAINQITAVKNVTKL